jgi:hypothetical protein
MRRLALVITVLALGGIAGSSAAPGQTINPFKTPAAMESFFLHGVTGGVFLQKGTTHYGPVVAVACRGEGPSKTTAQGKAYRRAICAVRVPNAARLLVLRYHTSGDFEILGFR